MRIDDIVLTSSETCHFYSITKTTLTNWMAKGFPKIGRNKYPLKAGHDFWRKNIIGEDAGDLLAERLKFQKARTRREELRAAQEASELVRRSDAIVWISQIVSEAKSNFWNLPRRFGEELSLITDPKEVETRLRDEIRRILTNLSKGMISSSGFPPNTEARAVGSKRRQGRFFEREK